MEKIFPTTLGDVGHEKNLVLLLSLVEADILKQSKFTDHEIENVKKIILELLQRQRNLKEIVALDLLEKQFSY